VTVATYVDAADAVVARDALTAAGIDAAAADTKLQVRREDALRAAAVLERDCATLPTVEEPDEPETDPTWCETCGAAEGTRTARLLMFLLVAVIGIGLGAATRTSEIVFFGVAAIGVYLLIMDRWRCPECGASWN
jgi:hypothetical protein